MNTLRNFVNDDRGRYLTIALIVVMLMLLGWLFVRQLGGSVAARSANRVFIDAKTGEPFGYELEPGETTPVPSPHSGGERVGYQAEPCHWTAGGEIKPEPTWVLPMVKADASAGPTFCPDCGRLVRLLNPIPAPGDKPPPTQAQYKAPPRGGAGEAPEADPDALRVE